MTMMMNIEAFVIDAFLFIVDVSVYDFRMAWNYYFNHQRSIVMRENIDDGDSIDNESHSFGVKLIVTF